MARRSRRTARRSVRRNESGWSLLEMTVALAVLAVGLALAVGLLVQSGRMGAELSRALRDPAPDLAVAQLRRDVQGASGAVAPGASFLNLGFWERGEMVLLPPGGGSGGLTYERLGDRLVRRLAGEASGRTVLEGVTSWRWRRGGGCPGELVGAAPLPTGRLVAVEIRYRPGASRRGAIATGGRLPDPQPDVVLSRCFALRGSGLGAGW